MFLKPAARLLVVALGSLPIFAGQANGINNFDKVDEHVYRGGQPNAEGIKYLAGIGVKVIIDLREAGGRSRSEEAAASASGVKYINVPMTGLTPPTEAEIAGLLKVMEDETAGPVFVHCMRGADRTGAVIAAYHIDHDKWDNDRAVKDAKAHGMSFFQLPRERFIRAFQTRTTDATVVAAPLPAAAVGAKN